MAMAMRFRVVAFDFLSSHSFARWDVVGGSFGRAEMPRDGRRRVE